MNKDVKLQEFQKTNLFDNVHIAEYVFCWKFSRSALISGRSIQFYSNCFTTKEDAYEYTWKATYSYRFGGFGSDSESISLLRKCRNSHSKDNKICVNLGIKKKDDDVYLLLKNLPASHMIDKYIDLSKAGSTIQGEIPVQLLNLSFDSWDIYNVMIKIKIFYKDLNFKGCYTNQLSTDFEKLYIGQQSTDVTFRFNNTKKINAHKCILMARSPVFQAMFQSDMLEKKENLVEIHDTNSEIFEELIHYIYTGQMKISSTDKLIDLMVLADKYALIEFRDYCENEIIRLMSVENAADNLIVSHLLNLDSLKTKSIEFILSKKKEILTSKGYQNLKRNHSHLISELFERS